MFHVCDKVLADSMSYQARLTMTKQLQESWGEVSYWQEEEEGEEEGEGEGIETQ